MTWQWLYVQTYKYRELLFPFLITELRFRWDETQHTREEEKGFEKKRLQKNRWLYEIYRYSFYSECLYMGGWYIRYKNMGFFGGNARAFRDIQGIIKGKQDI